MHNATYNIQDSLFLPHSSRHRPFHQKHIPSLPPSRKLGGNLTKIIMPGKSIQQNQKILNSPSIPPSTTTHPLLNPSGQMKKIYLSSLLQMKLPKQDSSRKAETT
jgi:hypothetical protein